MRNNQFNHNRFTKEFKDLIRFQYTNNLLSRHELALKYNLTKSEITYILYRSPNYFKR